MLPEKWCIKLTKENLEIVGGYYDKQTNHVRDSPLYNKDTRIDQFLTSHNQGDDRYIEKGNCGSNFLMYDVCDEFPEITTEDFIKYVLKQSIPESYEIY